MEGEEMDLILPLLQRTENKSKGIERKDESGKKRKKKENIERGRKKLLLKVCNLIDSLCSVIMVTKMSTLFLFFESERKKAKKKEKEEVREEKKLP